MVLVALKRLWSRLLLTLLSIVGVVLAVGLVTSIPIFSQAVSFRILDQELSEISARSGRPLFALRVYALPSAYPLSLRHTQDLSELIAETMATEVGLPVLSLNRHLETTGIMLRTRDESSPYGEPNTILGDTNVTVLPGVGSRMTIFDGESMETATSSSDALDVWVHVTIADEMGLQAGEDYEVRDLRRGVSVPVRIAGTWKATDPQDRYWFQDPDMSLRRLLLAREDDYRAIAEPLLDTRLGFVSWYLVMDDSLLVPEKMHDYAVGLVEGGKIIAEFLPDARIDGSPLDALDASIEREASLTALLFVFSVPLIGFLLYFLTLISTITIRWQRRETAMMVSRGMRRGQLLTVGVIESIIVVGLGCPAGILMGVQLAQVMGYTESFMSFVWREALPVSPTAFNLPMVAVAVAATSMAKLGPIFRAARTSVVEHERTRARAPMRPFWQRFYLDFVLLGVVTYARDQLLRRGTLVPEITAEEGVVGQEAVSWFAVVDRIYPEMFREQDPLMFLVPALFTMTLSLLLVRLFPLLMWIGDRLSSFGGEATFYLAFRQLARQSSQYTSALLLVITSLSLGAFMASMAASLDEWMIDRVYYAIGSDVLIKQTVPEVDELLDPPPPPPPPTEGAWILPADSYVELSGVIKAARVGMYPASVSVGERRALGGIFIGIDRLDVPEVLFFRPDFGRGPLGELLNRLAQREDGVILSDRVLARGNYEIGDKVRVRVNVADVVFLETDFTIAGAYKYFSTVYEERDGRTAIVGNLDYLFDQAGATLMHDVWLRIDPDSDRAAMIADVQEMGVYIGYWIDARDAIAREQARIERVGIFGTLTIGFLGAAALSGIGLLVYNYASLQERLFRFTVLRAVGLSLLQVVSQVSIEYLVLMVYSVAGGAAIGALASDWFIPFFQAADENVINPPTLLPLVAWGDIGKISSAFTIALVIAQIAVISAALRGGVFQALRMGDRE